MKFKSLFLFVALLLPSVAAVGAEPSKSAPTLPFPLFQAVQVQTASGPVSLMFTPGQAAGTYAVIVNGSSVWTIAPLGNTPGPLPPVPPPDELTGLAKQARDFAQELVPQDGRAKSASDLAGAMEGVLAAIAAGTIKDAATARSEMPKAAAKALGDKNAQWLQWAVKVAELMDAENKAGKLDWPTGYARAWGEIVRGLKAVK